MEPKANMDASVKEKISYPYVKVPYPHCVLKNGYCNQCWQNIHLCLTLDVNQTTTHKQINPQRVSEDFRLVVIMYQGFWVDT